MFVVGHGKSDGDRCHVNTYDKYVQDVVKHVTLMKEKYPNKPVFIIGHSMVPFLCLKKHSKRQNDVENKIVILSHKKGS